MLPQDYAAAEEFLARSYRSGKGHHAMLFEGPEGIGKATLAFRFANHVLSHPDPASAPETIGDPDLLARGEVKLLWNGLWREGTRERLPEFLRDSTRLFEAAKRNLQLEQIFVAPLEVEDRLRRRIEGAIAKQIRKDKVAASLLPPDIRVLGRLTTEAPLPVRIRCGAKILGLPEQLDV